MVVSLFLAMQWLFMGVPEGVPPGVLLVPGVLVVSISMGAAPSSASLAAFSFFSLWRTCFIIASSDTLFGLILGFETLAISASLVKSIIACITCTAQR